jgi:SAM-dependent methyltransferase
VVDNVPIFLSAKEQESALNAVANDRENGIKNFFKSWPKLYQALVYLIVPILYTGLTPKQFFKRLPSDARMLNIGSGPSLVHPRVLNVDLFAFSNVHIVASADALPFASESFDAICTEQVLEHVAHPQRVATELLRVLKKGGVIYNAVPFMYPLHPSPKDYSRWSIDGMAALFPGSSIVEQGILIGPVCGMLSVLATGLAIIFSFGISALRTFFTALLMLLLSPLRFLDLLYARLPGAEYSALSVYVVMEKK